jgi:hypothetical protein
MKDIRRTRFAGGFQFDGQVSISKYNRRSGKIYRQLKITFPNKSLFQQITKPTIMKSKLFIVFFIMLLITGCVADKKVVIPNHTVPIGFTTDEETIRS